MTLGPKMTLGQNRNREPCAPSPRFKAVAISKLNLDSDTKPGQMTQNLTYDETVYLKFVA